MEDGEIDMVMSSQRQLLLLTNYLELPGYKANVIFDRSFESSFGFNKDEAILCSIVDKALRMVDKQGITDIWIRKTYDYRAKLAQARLPLLIGISVLLLCVLVLMFVLFQRNRHAGKQLKYLVQERTAALNKQHALMGAVNDTAALLLEADAGDPLNMMSKGMETIGRHVDVERVCVWQNLRKDDGKLYYRLICEWSDEIALNIQRTLAKLEAVTNHYKCIIWSVDKDGIITIFNGQYLKVIGVQPSFPEGKKLEIARLENRHLAIIAMTANVFREDVEKCLEAGMNSHIGKPLDFDEVIGKLRAYLPQNN